MLARHLFLGTIVTLAGTTALQAQAQFIPIPNGFSATDITPDGKTVVGYGTDPSTGSGAAFYWEWQTDPAPNFIGGSFASGVSDDGNVIVGCIKDPIFNADVAARWEPTTGWVSLGYLPNALSCPSKSDAYDVSGDGSTVVGLSWEGCDGRGFVWTQATGMLALQPLGAGQNRASVISGNGAIIGGFAQGSFSRTPVTWDPTSTLGTLFDFNSLGEVGGMDETGNILVGEFDGYAFYRVGAQPLVNIGTLNSGWIGQGTDVSADGGIICGFDSLGLGSEAWVWTEDDGIISLQQRLTNAGVAGVPTLGNCQAMTPDGSVMVGNTPFQGCWIAVLPRAEANVFGCGLNPAGSMQVSGVPTLGSVVTLGLDNPLGTQNPGSGTLLMVGFAPQPTFPCGIPTFDGSMQPGQPGELLVNPVIFLPGLPWAGTGTPANFPIPIPTSPPTVIGLTIYCQGAILDSSPGGINGLTDAAQLKIALF